MLGIFLRHFLLVVSTPEKSVIGVRLRYPISSELTDALIMDTKPVIARELESSKSFPVSQQEARELFGLLATALRLNVAVRRRVAKANVPHISLKLIPALFYLEQFGEQPVTVGQLANGVGKSRSWASRATEELISLGLLESIRDPHDRRCLRLRLTAQAAGYSRLWSDRESAIVVALEGIPPEQRPAIRRFLVRLVNELNRSG